ncbi:FxSxx-COOH system tetratricopeptide repeat protein [Umezawaea endophytica]|uniref:FxSxx-COOH system tetratricopeptide repeat protein n=1 Tax=Umezawaea endophytica TaxID=1654476 RepID=A0A9X2VGN7_9PSEU|nr:FxSxx-COOH system tetratricopeptide repeat protein [Umezawaea endophytica]MCS7475777.1 FxSxx-COOH system tetratricopeptide repeat protein [Umezawaea endophytica]
MSRSPFGDLPEEDDLDPVGIHTALLQQFESTALPERLRAADLTYRELRDGLWLARRLPRPVEPDHPPQPAEDKSPPEQPAVETPRFEDSAPEQDNTPDDIDPPTFLDNASEAGGKEDWEPRTAVVNSGSTLSEANGGVDARAAWPTIPALSEAARISQALRPFARRSPSPWRKVLDEEATAIRAAQEELWIPEWKAAEWRRFEVVLVIDASPSMDIWQRTAHEFRELLLRQGAFRNVRCFSLDGSRTSVEDLVLVPESGTGAPRHWSHLVDNTERRIVLVLTDAIGAGWRNGAAASLLHRWGRTMPVAVIHMMAQRLWHWGGLVAKRVRLSAPRPGAANKHLVVAPVDPDLAVDGDERSGIAVPVLGLSDEWFTGWTRLLTAPDGEWIETTAALVHLNGYEILPDPVTDPAPLTARARVLRFRTVASVQAFRLAGLLAATPMNLSTMKLVQRVLLPGSTLSTLAEVMLSGLVTRSAPQGSSTGRGVVSYDFSAGVREELLAGGTRADTARVARILGDYGGSEVSALRNFREAVNDPEETEIPQISDATLPYLRVQEAVFRALSGGYASRARELRKLLRVADERSSDQDVRGMESGALEEDDALTTADPLPLPRQSEDRPFTEGDFMSINETTSSADPRGGTPRRPQVWGPVPLRNPDFVGRKQLLEQLRQRLIEPGATAVLPEALHGMGGVGKSQTVVEYIYQHASEYDVVWWISAEHPAQITSSFVELAKRLGVPASGTADTAVPAVLEALRRGEPYSRWILVFDNADRPELVRPYLPAGSGHIVVTSRNSDWAGVARAVEVDLFTRAESKELLGMRGGALDDADADRLAEALGDLPLAIEQAAAWRAQTGMQVSEYLELLQQNRMELLSTGTATGYQLPVAAAWNVPLEKLKNEHQAALQLLQVCAFFGPEPISRKLFSGVRGTPVPEALDEAFGDPIKLNRAIREISKYSLAKIDHRNNSLQLHRLVQTVLKNRLNEDEQNKMRHSVHLLLVNGDPGDPDASANWPRYAELLPHATMALAVQSKDKWVRELIHNLVRYLLNSGDYGAARDLAVQAVDAWKPLLGDSDLDTLEMTRRYAIALRRLGHTEEAQLLNEKTYETLRLTVGDDHENVLGMLDTVAADRRSQGLFAEELELQQDVYQRSRRVLGEDDPATLIYANNLASCYRLMGDFFRARDIDEDTLRRRTAVLGADHLLTFRSLNALSMDLRECGLYVEAARQQESTLAKQIEIFGRDHPSIIGATRNLAVARRKAGDHDGAKELATDCFDRYRRQSGDSHVDTVTAMMTLSTDLRHLHDMDASEELAERSHRQFSEVRGPTHPYTLIAATNLAVTLRLRGDVEKARKLDEFASVSLREVFNSDHPFTLVSTTNLASDLAALGDHTTAETLDRDTFDRSIRVLGPEHPSTLAVALNLAIDLGQLGKDDEAAILHTKTVTSFRKVLGDDHPATTAASQSVRANCDTDTMQL